MLGKFLNKVLIGAKNINRWEGHERCNKNTDAEHMWCTTMICDQLGRIQQDIFHDNVDFLVLLRRSLYHDVIEVETGDILSGVKRTTTEMKDCLTKIEKIRFDTAIKPLISSAYRDELETYILNPKDNLQSVEGRILAVADKIDTLMETVREVKKGNSNFIPHLQSESEAILNLKIPCGLYFIKYSLGDFGISIDRYGLKVSQFVELFDMNSYINEYIEKNQQLAANNNINN